VNPRTDLTKKIAQALAAHAVRVGAPAHAEWTKAMMHEQEHLPPDASAVSWALGCVCVSYRGRIRALIRLPNAPRRVALLGILLLCLIPASWSFMYVASNIAQDYPLSSGARLDLGLATLIGPIGLAAALWTLASPSHRPRTIFIVVLWALTVWAITMMTLSAQYPLLTHAKPGITKILLNLVVLPVLVVALLQALDVRRRRSVD
jgi:CDP-diglyceride synthetase